MKRRVEPRFRAAAAQQNTCANPDCLTPRAHWHPHHVVYEQHVDRYGGDISDGRNALRVCMTCHGRHHKRIDTLPVSALTDENVEFAVELLGAAHASVYLGRYYCAADDDPRVAAFLEAGGVA